MNSDELAAEGNLAIVPRAVWEHIREFLPPAERKRRKGRPRTDDRMVFSAIVYKLRTGCPWKAIPTGLGAGSTAHERFREWTRLGLFSELHDAGLLDSLIGDRGALHEGLNSIRDGARDTSVSVDAKIEELLDLLDSGILALDRALRVTGRPGLMEPHPQGFSRLDGMISRSYAQYKIWTREDTGPNEFAVRRFVFEVVQDILSLVAIEGLGQRDLDRVLSAEEKRVLSDLRRLS